MVFATKHIKNLVFTLKHTNEEVQPVGIGNKIYGKKGNDL
jgi:hypothetical protein